MKSQPPVVQALNLGSFTAGTELQIFPNTVNGNSTWILFGLTYDFTTSAVAGNRQSVLSLEVGGVRVLRIPQNSAQAASLTRRTSCYPGAQAGAGVGNDVNLALPNGGLLLRPGYVLQTRTTAIDAGDQYTNVVVFYAELYPASSEVLVPGYLAQLFSAGQSL